MKKMVIGLVGEIGSGKATFTKLLSDVISQEHSIKSESFSNILIETLKMWSIPLTRENIQNLSIAMVNTYGEGVLSKAVYNRVKNMTEDIIILDGVRWQSDLSMLRKFPNNLLVYITSDLEIRYKRTKQRGQKAGEKRTSLEKFKKQHLAHTEIFIPEIGAQADFKIVNNGTLEQYRSKVEEFYKTQVLKKLT